MLNLESLSGSSPGVERHFEEQALNRGERGGGLFLPQGTHENLVQKLMFQPTPLVIFWRAIFECLHTTGISNDEALN